MNAHGLAIRNVRAWVVLCVVLALAACNVNYTEVTSTKPYANLIGAQYEVVAESLDAYGVYETDFKTLGYVTLVPSKIGGREFAFERSVPPGQVIRILSAWRRVFLWETGVYYLVELENSNLPRGLPIRLELNRGNDGVGAELNPAVYKKLPREN